jgi:hypothetical protein
MGKRDPRVDAYIGKAAGFAKPILTRVREAVHASYPDVEEAMTPQQLQDQYGIADAYSGQVATSDGPLRGTLVPVTLPDGRKVQLVIPNQRANAPHAASAA